VQYDSISRLQINNLYTNSIDQKFINVIIGDILIPSCGCNTNKKMNKLIEIFNLETNLGIPIKISTNRCALPSMLENFIKFENYKIKKI
jgi:hypothetical protein